MFKIVLFLLLLLVLPSLCWGYAFSDIDVVCGSGCANKVVDVSLSLTNIGGMNIFYFASNTDQFIMNLYGNVSSKNVIVHGLADGSGNVEIAVSANYGSGFSISVLGCSVDNTAGDYWKIISLILGGIAALSLVLGSSLRW